jgi:hypothetical protein
MTVLLECRVQWLYYSTWPGKRQTNLNLDLNLNQSSPQMYVGIPGGEVPKTLVTIDAVGMSDESELLTAGGLSTQHAGKLDMVAHSVAGELSDFLVSNVQGNL